MEKTLEKKIISIGQVVIGLLAIIFAIICWSADPCFWDATHCSYETYGGDAYTGMQNASAHTANNIFYLNLNLQYAVRFFASCAGYLLFIVGVSFVLIGAVKTISSFKNN